MQSSLRIPTVGKTGGGGRPLGRVVPHPGHWPGLDALVNGNLA